MITRNPKIKVLNHLLKIKIFNLCLVFLTFNLCLLTFIHPAKAQSFSLSIAPPLLEVMIKPGKSVTYAYNITNDGEDLILNSQIVFFTPKDEMGNILLKNNPAGIPNYFSFNNTDTYLGVPFVLKSGQKKQVVLKISVPKDAEEKDYYLTLLFTSQNNRTLNAFGTKQTGVIGSNLLLTVSDSGKPLRRGEIAEFKTYPSTTFKIGTFQLSIIDSFDIPKFLLRLKNYGKTLWKPYGKITVNGSFGQKWQHEILPQNVLADSIRQVEISTPSAIQHFLLGPYNVKTEFILDEETQDQIITGNISFIALPIKTTLFLLTTLFILSIVKLVGKKGLLKKVHKRT